MEYHNNFLPGDVVGIKDDGYVEIPKGYYYSGMILKEKAPIHTFIYYVMLYPKNKNAENHIKIIEIPEEHLILDRFINRDHYDIGSSKYRVIHILNNILFTIRNIEVTEETESLLNFILGYVQGLIDFEKTNLDRENKLHLSSPYGEVLNNGKTKPNN